MQNICYASDFIIDAEPMAIATSLWTNGMDKADSCHI